MPLDSLLSNMLAWKEARVIVKPETMNRWPRKGFEPTFPF